MSNSDKGIFGCFGILISTFLVIVVSTLIRGWALSVLWAWFAVPVFSAPLLSIPQALGLSIMVGFFTYRKADENKNNKERDVFDAFLFAFLEATIVPLLSVGMGYIVTLFL